MKRRIRLISIIILTGLSIFSGCSNRTVQNYTRLSPPESKKVLENGSVPPGFKKAVKSSGLNFDCITCNSQNRYGKYLKSYSEDSAKDLLKKILPLFSSLKVSAKNKLFEYFEDHLMWAMVRAVLIEGDNNNFGAIVLKGKFWKDRAGKKHPLTIFRTAFSPSPDAPGSCYYSLLNCGNVRYVVNLYDGEMDVSDLVDAEKRTAKKFGATYLKASNEGYGGWRDSVRKHPGPGPQRDAAKKLVVRLIREQILKPGGEEPKGNILIHCGGGMHRTGMIIGILQKVINGNSMEEIERGYTYHVGYRSKDKPGGFEQGNLDFIRLFTIEDFK